MTGREREYTLPAISRQERIGGARMEKSRVSKETLKAMAALSGLELGDERLEELLPQAQKAAEDMASLDGLDLEGIEPAVGFRADRG